MNVNTCVCMLYDVVMPMGFMCMCVCVCMRPCTDQVDASVFACMHVRMKRDSPGGSRVPCTGCSFTAATASMRYACRRKYRHTTADCWQHDVRQVCWASRESAPKCAWSKCCISRPSGGHCVCSCRQGCWLPHHVCQQNACCLGRGGVSCQG